MMTLTQRLIVGAMLLAAMLISCNNKTDSTTTNQGRPSNKIATENGRELKRTPEEAHLYEQKVLATNAHRTTYTGPSSPEILWRTDVWEKSEFLDVIQDTARCEEIDADSDGQKEYLDKLSNEYADVWKLLNMSTGYRDNLILTAQLGYLKDCRVIQIAPDGQITKDTDNLLDSHGLLRLINDVSPVYAGVLRKHINSLNNGFDSPNHDPDNFPTNQIVLVNEKFDQFWTAPFREEMIGVSNLAFDGDFIYACDEFWIELNNHKDESDYTPHGWFYKFNTAGEDFQECVIDRVPTYAELTVSWNLECIGLDGSVLLTTNKAALCITNDCEIEWMIDPGYEIESSVYPGAVALADGSFIIEAKDHDGGNEESVSVEDKSFLAIITADGKHIKPVTPKYDGISSVAVSKDSTIAFIYYTCTYPEKQDASLEKLGIRLWDAAEATLTVINTDGGVLWERKLCDYKFQWLLPSTLWLDDESNIYCKYDGSFVSFDINSNERWRFNRNELNLLDFCVANNGGVCFASNGNIYLAGNGEVICIGDR